jgi:hypothetical protein
MNAIDNFISNIENKTRKPDAIALLSMLSKVSGYKPYLTGSIIGFGRYHYKYDSGREGDCAVISFSPRKQNLVVYIMPGFDKFESLLQELGKHKCGKSCLYINKLSDLKLNILGEIAKLSIQAMQQKYACTDG